LLLALSLVDLVSTYFKVMLYEFFYIDLKLMCVAYILTSSLLYVVTQSLTIY